MTRFLFLIFFTTVWSQVIKGAQASNSQYDQLSVSVLTCGPGDLLYSLFGHSALRLQDSQRNIDLVYNWGTFDFNTPGFAIKFLRGKLPYALSVSTYDAFIKEYIRDQRDVVEQLLELDYSQKTELLELLNANMLEENRYYAYDFYFDNCTSRIKHLLEKVGATVIYGDKINGDATYRNLLHEYLQHHPWTRFGMDIILGTLSDRIATQDGQMFLPEYFYSYLNSANSRSRPFVLSENSLLTFERTQNKKIRISPNQLFLFILGVEIIGLFLFYISGDRGFLKVIDRIWFVFLSIACVVFLFMWCATNHEVCKDNWNLLWAGPWAFLYFNQNSFLKKVCYVSTIVASAIIMFAWNLIPQSLPVVVGIIAGISFLKSIRLMGVVKLIDGLKKSVVAVVLFLLVYSGVNAQEKIGGITLVAPPREFQQDPFIELKRVNAQWVALVPYAFSRNGEPDVRFGSNRQWWGERKEGIKKSIELAQKNQFKIMIKPQVWIPGGWVGEMDFEKEGDWRVWEESYRSYIMSFIELASEYQVEIFCVGTEYRLSSKKRENFWRDLIREIRKIYKGKLTYSANWDAYEEIPFWDQLDYIGISAYFPLTEMNTPPEVLLNYKWKKYIRKLDKFSSKHQKPILFTEFGYLSVDGAAGKTWELEEDIRERPINQRAQANGYNALLRAFSSKDFWAGGFLWKWFPDGKGHEGYPERDYTPQNKMAQEVISKWYGQFQM